MVLKNIDFSSGVLRAELQSEGGGSFPFSAGFVFPGSFRIVIGGENPNSCLETAPGFVETKGYFDGEVFYIGDEISILEVQIEPFAIRVRDAASSEIITETKSQDPDASGKNLSPGCGFDVQEALQVVSWHLFPDEHFFGLGEKFTDWNKRGQVITCWNHNAYGAGSEKSYKNIPLLLSSRKYAIFANTTSKVVFDLGKSSNFSYFFTVYEPVLDFFCIRGVSFSDILKQYFRLTGWPSSVPLWSLGLWVSVFGDHRSGDTMDAERILEILREAQEQGFPLDVLHLDPFWMGENSYCSFQWDPEYFPDPENFLKKVHERGVKVCLWEHPYLDVNTKIFREAQARGYLIKDKMGNSYIAPLAFRGIKPEARRNKERYSPAGIVDFSNPEAREWYKEKHRRLIEMGVSTFKTDFGEEIPEDGFFHNGKTGKEMHNLYPLLYNQTVYEVLSEYYREPIVWGRSGFSGMQKYPLCWSGDPLCNFDSMAATLRGGLSLSVSGVPFWSHDVGGFMGSPDPLLFIRWLQFAVFCSHIRLHGTTTRLPWKFDRHTCEIARKFLRLRYRLLPYLWREAMRVKEEGSLFLRPLFWEYPEDPTTFWIWWEYFLGESFLISPVLSPENEVNIYLPSGKWLDFWNDEVIVGPRWLKRHVSLDKMPVFVRENSVIPQVRNPIWRSEELWSTLSLDVFGVAPLEQKIPIAENMFALLKVHGAGEKWVIHLQAPQSRNWILSLYDVDKPLDVYTEPSIRWLWKNNTLRVFFKDSSHFNLCVVFTQS
ncbi:MAG: alpha-xylosidase [Candidatus Atribacteria bacterium]|nr:alpha-xylosidase [Candidatus Atribacteria bacterium]MCD6350065.1 alpha-xylosidase [Candidatus Atribacteria bacterium]